MAKKAKEDKKKLPAHKRKPLGKALPPVTEKIAAPSRQEKDEMIARWDTYAPAQYRGMMSAENKQKLEKAGKKPSGIWVWDLETRTYTNVKTGHIVDQDEAKAAFTAYLRAFTKA